MLAMVVRVEWVRARMIRDSLSAAARKPEKGKLGLFMHATRCLLSLFFVSGTDANSPKRKLIVGEMSEM